MRSPTARRTLSDAQTIQVPGAQRQERTPISLSWASILRDGRARCRRGPEPDSAALYDEEIEHLETITMVLAELVATGELVGKDELFSKGGAFGMQVLKEAAVMAALRLERRCCMPQ